MLQRNLEYFTLHDFLEWVEKQEGEYDYSDPTKCACAQFLRQRVGESILVSVNHWHPNSWNVNDYHKLPEGVGDAVWNRPRTFTALASRLRAEIKRQDSHA